MSESKKLIQPKKLEKGDRVGVVAPAGPVDPDLLEKGLAVLKKMKLVPLLGKHVLSRRKYLAGRDEDRAEDLMSMFENQDVKAIICARGGYGVNRLLPWLKPKVIRENPKIFVGASDITLLLLYLYQKCSLVGFHGPMVAGNFGQYAMKKSRKQFLNLLTGQPEGQTMVSPQARVLHPGVARGEIIGGCLTLLCRSLKTPFEVKTANKILLIEDVNEAPYRVDGMLWQLKAAGKFKGIKGIILGEMVNCHLQKTRNGLSKQMYQELFDELSVPIVSNFPVGHGKEMWTLPFGVEATLDAEAKSIRLKHCGVK
ncbi:MAG: peptidase S66 [Nitrospinaceae bacterium]|nr:MAG: peptidase S66 [Nitrospinaceae bacterium]